MPHFADPKYSALISMVYLHLSQFIVETNIADPKLQLALSGYLNVYTILFEWYSTFFGELGIAT